MNGERNLEKLLANVSPVLMPGEFVFCSFENARYGDYADLEPVAAVSENEGLTLVLLKTKADAQALSYESVFRCVTLNVHSSLNAIGLTAAVSNKLAEREISANMIAGFFHDHVFVQKELAEKAIAAIGELSH